MKATKAIPKNNTKKGDLLTRLHELQEANTDGAHLAGSQMRKLARELDMPIAELDGIASFYRLLSRRPRGQHVIRLCDSLTCRIKDSLDIYYHLHKRLGISKNETTPDGTFSLEIVNCLGCCDTAPNMMIDDRLYRSLTVERVDEILDEIEKEASK